MRRCPGGEAASNQHLSASMRQHRPDTYIQLGWHVASPGLPSNSMPCSADAELVDSMFNAENGMVCHAAATLASLVFWHRATSFCGHPLPHHFSLKYIYIYVYIYIYMCIHVDGHSLRLLLAVRFVMHVSTSSQAICVPGGAPSSEVKYAAHLEGSQSGCWSCMNACGVHAARRTRSHVGFSHQHFTLARSHDRDSSRSCSGRCRGACC